MSHLVRRRTTLAGASAALLGLASAPAASAAPALMTNGDGLLLLGRRLYVVQNRLNKIAVLTLNSSGTQGTVVGELTSPDFDVPTTAAAFGDRLYLPNARFTTSPTPTTEYWVTAVRR